MGNLIVSALAVIGGWLGAYFGAYMKKKGENLATHEDIDKLVAQMAAITKATKEIESKISSDVWDRQKQWELKRDVLLEATKRLVGLENALVGIDSMAQTEGGIINPNQGSWVQLKHQKIKEWTVADSAFDESRCFAAVLCTLETTLVFEDFAKCAGGIVAKICAENNREAYKKSKAEFLRKGAAVRVAIRRELGIEHLYTSQSEGTLTSLLDLPSSQ